MTAILRDLSKEAGLEREVRQSQRLAILGEMVATVSHEIRSPLALIGASPASWSAIPTWAKSRSTS